MQLDLKFNTRVIYIKAKCAGKSCVEGPFLESAGQIVTQLPNLYIKQLASWHKILRKVSKLFGWMG